MPLGIQRLNAKTSQPNPQIVFIKPLAGRDEAIARSFLERIAAQCLPVMRDNHLSVMSLEEFEPNREFVGRNFNAGEVIQLVLKSPSSGRWLPFEYVQMVMMHELAHCKQMNHSRAFWAVRNQYATQMYGLWSKGYTGDGLWGRGANLATGQWEKNTVRDGEVLPEHLCGGTYRSRRKRKGKQQLSYQERKQRRIEKKFGKNGVELGDDEATKVKLEKGKRVQAKPRVAGSARGRELRAAAALARFGNQKKVKQEDLELKEEYDSDGEAEEDQEPDAMDFDGSRIVDGDGRGMVKVCEDEDATDPSAKSELDELRGVFNGQVKIKAEPDDTDVGIPASLASTSSPRIKEEPAEKSILTEQLQPKQPQQQRPKLASPGVKREAAEESDQPPRLEGVKNEAENRAICRMCSFENSGHSLTCAMCSNVLEPDLAPSCWTCTSQACSGTQYVNAGDCGVCGLCGQRRP
ncbi:hypothetical protein Golomagni_06280 [Golovinomyces magnicellulatus]|nr:hypothetical protein Golomagni_06280 [Golovinomyces magnicellulatus]